MHICIMQFLLNMEHEAPMTSGNGHKCPGVLAESVEHGPRVREIWSLVPGRVKPITYKFIFVAS